MNAKIIVSLLEALTDSWGEAQTYEEIGWDRDKIKLLRAASECVDPADLPPRVREFYKEVFLYDVWECAGDQS